MPISFDLSPLWLISWLLIPYLAAFIAALLPSVGPGLLLLSSLATVLVGLFPLLGESSVPLDLLGRYGVSLNLDLQAGWFVLLNGVLFTAVLLDGWQRRCAGQSAMLLLVLQGGLNTAFLCTDLISLYVTLEVIGISAFLLILSGRSDRSLWVGLRYLLVGNTAMSLYLIGAGLAYSQTGSFTFESLRDLALGAPQVFLLIGLLTKAGLFVSGLWLPSTHAQASPEISALLSGVVVTAGAAPLLRIGELNASLQLVLQVVGLASALLGLIYALCIHDAKRLLAWSTLSQMGLVVLSPASGGLMALAHGFAKATLFLQARSFATRDLRHWSQQRLSGAVWIPLLIASVSIPGLPPLLGAAAKKSLSEVLPLPWSVLPELLAIGSVAVYARLCSVPVIAACQPSSAASTPHGSTSPESSAGSWGSWLLVAALLIGGWVAASPGDWLATALVFGAGLLLHLLLEALRRRQDLQLPALDSLQALIGNLGLVGAALLMALRGV